MDKLNLICNDINARVANGEITEEFAEAVKDAAIEKYVPEKDVKHVAIASAGVTAAAIAGLSVLFKKGKRKLMTDKNYVKLLPSVCNEIENDAKKSIAKMEEVMNSADVSPAGKRDCKFVITAYKKLVNNYIRDIKKTVSADELAVVHTKYSIKANALVSMLNAKVKQESVDDIDAYLDTIAESVDMKAVKGELKSIKGNAKNKLKAIVKSTNNTFKKLAIKFKKTASSAVTTVKKKIIKEGAEDFSFVNPSLDNDIDFFVNSLQTDLSNCEDTVKKNEASLTPGELKLIKDFCNDYEKLVNTAVAEVNKAKDEYDLAAIASSYNAKLNVLSIRFSQKIEEYYKN